MILKQLFGYCYSLKSDGFFDNSVRELKYDYHKGLGALECFELSDDFHALSQAEMLEFQKFVDGYKDFFFHLIKKAEAREVEGKSSSSISS